VFNGGVFSLVGWQPVANKRKIKTYSSDLMFPVTFCASRAWPLHSGMPGRSFDDCLFPCQAVEFKKEMAAFTAALLKSIAVSV
jgi:hypothetical protein